MDITYMPPKLSHPNKPKKSSESKKKAIVLSIATCALLGIISYEVIQERELHLPASPVQDFIIPPLENQNERLHAELNHVLRKNNELKRLLFVRGHAPENTHLEQLQQALEEKNQLLKTSTNQLAALEKDLAQEQLRTNSLEASLMALADMVDNQTILKKEFEQTLENSIAQVKEETLQKAQSTTDQLEQLIAERSQEIESLKEQILYQQMALQIFAETQKTERDQLIEEYKNKEAHAEELKIADAEVRQQYDQAQTDKLNTLSKHLTQLKQDLHAKENSHALLEHTLQNSYLHHAQLEDELAIERAFTHLISHQDDTVIQNELITLKNTVDLLQAELQLAKATLENEKQAKYLLANELEYLTQQNVPDNTSESLSTQESQTLVETINSLKNDYQEAFLQVHLQQEREHLLQTALAELEQKYHSLQCDNQNHLEAIHQLSVEIKELSQALLLTENQREELKAELEHQLTTLLDEMQWDELRIDTLSQAIQQEQEQKTKIQNELVQLQQEHLQKQSYINHLLIEAADSQSIHDLLMRQLATQEQLLKDQQFEWEEIAANYLDTKQYLQSELELLQDKVRQKEDLHESTHELAHLQNQLENLVLEKENLLKTHDHEKEKALAYFKNEYESLQEKYVSEKQQASELEQELLIVLSNYETASKIISELQSTLQEKTHAMDDHLQVNSHLEEQVTQLQNQLQAYEKQALQLQNQLAEADQKQRKTEASIAKLQQTLATEHESLQQELAAAETSKQQLENTLTQLQAELADISEAKNQLNQALQEKAHAIDDHLQVNSDLEIQITQLQNQLQAQERQTLQLQDQLAEADQKQREMEASIAKLHQTLATEHESLQQELTTKEASKQQLENTLTQLQAELADISEAKNQLNQALQEKAHAMDAHLQVNSHLEEQVTQLQNQLQAQERQTLQLQDQLAEADQKQREMEASIAKLHQALAVERETVQYELTVEETLKHQLEGTLTQLKAEITNVNEEKSQLIQALTKAEQAHQATLQERASMNDHIQINSHLKEEIAHIQNQLQAQEKQALHLQDQLTEAYQKQREAEELVVKLHQSLEAKREALQQELAAEEQVKSELVTSLTQLKAELTQVITERNQLNKILEDAAQDLNGTYNRIATLEALSIEKDAVYHQELAHHEKYIAQLQSDLNRLKLAQQNEQKHSQSLEQALQQTKETLRLSEHSLKDLNGQTQTQELSNTDLKATHRLLEEKIQTTAALEQNLELLQQKYYSALRTIEALEKQIKTHQPLVLPNQDSEITHESEEDIKQLQSSLEKEKQRLYNFQEQVNAMHQEYELTNRAFSNLQNNDPTFFAQTLHDRFKNFTQEKKTILEQYRILTAFLENQKNALNTLQKESQRLAESMHTNSYGSNSANESYKLKG